MNNLEMVEFDRTSPARLGSRWTTELPPQRSAAGGGRPDGGTRARTILLPIGMSRPAPAAVGLALGLAQQTGGSLVLVHAAQLNIGGEELGIRRGSLLVELLREAEARLKGIATALSPQVRAEAVAVEGAPAPAIVETAKAFGADAIVLEKPRRRSWWRRWLSRDVAAQVARTAPCAVYLVSPSDGSAN